MTKLWGGRFLERSDQWIDEFGASINIDQQLAVEDIEGSLAHVTMLIKCGILEEKDGLKIKDGLIKLLEKARKKELQWKAEYEDVHLNIEKMLIDEVGSVGGKLHTARSRNDQVAVDMHVYLKKSVTEIVMCIKEVQAVLVEKAEANIETIMPGYTHLQRAQPISFAHHLLAYFWMLERDKERYTDGVKRINLSPLGCGALAGTTFPINRMETASLLGLDSIYENSMDGVSDRDFILEFLSTSSILMMHLSRFCEELILWCSQEFQFIEMSDKYATGSSIMPQKKNPDMAELIRGKTGRVYGNLVGLLTIMKGLPLAYNKDLQEDKQGMFDTVETVKNCLLVLKGMVETMRVQKEKMEQATMQDFSNATELADYLANKGIPFRQAHEIVGKLVLQCIQKGIFLLDMPFTEYQAASPLFEEDIYEILHPRTAVARRISYGGTGFKEVERSIEKAKKILQQSGGAEFLK